MTRMRLGELGMRLADSFLSQVSGHANVSERWHFVRSTG